MPEPTVPDPQDPNNEPAPLAEPPKPEEKKDAVPHPGNIRDLSFQQVAENAAAREKAEKEKNAQPTEKPEETPAAPKNTTQIDVDKLRAKETAEIAAKTAAEVLAKQQELQDKREELARKAREDEERRKAEDERRKEALKPKFTGRDKDGNVVPKDYNELAAESARIGREEALAEFEDRQRKEREQLSAEEEQKAKQADEAKARQEEFNKQLSTVIQEETDELFSSGKLPRIVNPDDPNDPGNVALRSLLEQGAKINEQRAKEGKPVITSLTRIYTSYYKPPKELANAPVQGNTPATPSGGESKDYDFKKFHNMPIPQFLAEMARRRKPGQA